MVNTPVTGAREAERRLVIGYAPATARSALAALLALDARLGEIVASTREPLVGQMRLTWWYEVLRGLDSVPPPAEPVLAMVAADVLPLGVSGEALAAMIDGWESLLVEPLDGAAASHHAETRGGGLFAAAAAVLGAPAMMPAMAGEGWALADLAARLADPKARSSAAAQAVPLIEASLRRRWPVALRALGALVIGARYDLAGVPAGSPRRVARLAWHRLTGR